MRACGCFRCAYGTPGLFLPVWFTSFVWLRALTHAYLRSALSFFPFGLSGKKQTPHRTHFSIHSSRHHHHTETVWRTAQKHKTPAIAFVNKLDREGADFKHVLGTLERRLGVLPLPLQVRIRELHMKRRAMKSVANAYSSTVCIYLLKVCMLFCSRIAVPGLQLRVRDQSVHTTRCCRLGKNVEGFLFHTVTLSPHHLLSPYAPSLCQPHLSSLDLIFLIPTLSRSFRYPAPPPPILSLPPSFFFLRCKHSRCLYRCRWAPGQIL